VRLPSGKPFGLRPGRPGAGLVVVVTMLTSCAVAFAGSAALRQDGDGPRWTCRGERATVVGTVGADRLVGTPGRDVIVARAGDDVVRGLGGADFICDNRGDDRVSGGAGDDEIGGGPGADRIDGGAGDDRLLGRSGADVIAGGPGDDRLRGERGADRLRGDGGDDRLVGGPGRDGCSGGSGTNLLLGCESGAAGSADPGPGPAAPPADQPPVAGADAATVAEGSAAQDVPVLANDGDPDGGPKSIASVTQPAHGTVQVTGGGTGLSYEPDAKYCNDGGATDDFAYALAPGGSSATVAMSVTCANDAPEVTLAAGSLAYAEGDPPAALGAALSVSDVDDTSLERAEVGISAGLQAGDDVLHFSAPPGIAGGYDSGTGLLTFTGAASVADYQAALRSVKYEHSGDDPLLAKSVSFRADDGDGFGPAATRDIDLTPVNDAPTLATTSGTTAFTEGGGSVTIDGDVLVADPDSAQLSGATVSITAAFAPGEDVLGFADQNGIAGSYSATTGVLTLTGDASLADYHAALSSITYDNSSEDPSTATRTISFQATDDGTPPEAGNVATRNVSLTAGNDAPQVTTSGGTTSYTERAPAVTVDGGVTPADPDDANLEGATVSVASGLQTGDELVFGGQPGIVGTYDAGTGVLTLTGTASRSDYQTALRSIGFRSTNVDPVASKTVEFTVADGEAGSNAAAKEIAVTPVNDPPQVGAGGTLGYDENDPATAVHAGLTVSEPEDDAIGAASASITAGFQAGEDVLGWTDNDLGDNIMLDALGSNAQTVVLTGMDTAARYQEALRAVTYRNSSESPSAVSRTVTFTATDVLGLPGTDTRAIAVTPVDDPPEAEHDSSTVLEDDPATAIAVLGNDTDVDGGTTTISSATDPANGTVVLTGGSTGAHTGLTYEPDPDYCNFPGGPTPDTFGYTLNGGDSAVVSMTVTCVNDAPVADDETFGDDDSAIGNTLMVVDDPDDGPPSGSGPKTTVSGDILAGDTDPDGPALTVEEGTFPTDDGGSVTLEADGDFSFAPAAGRSCTDTSDSFEYTVQDGGSPEETDTGTVTIAIAGCVWYLSNNAAGNSGTSTAPFDTLAQAETASSANHTVFVFDGDNTSTGYASGYLLNPGERLIGEHEGLVVDPDQGGPLTEDTLLPANPGAHPTLSATGRDVVSLDDNNEVRGFNIDPEGNGGGIFAGLGVSGGGIVSDVNVDDNGTPGSQPGIELAGPDGSINFADITVDNGGSATAIGMRLHDATVNFASEGTVRIATSGARALDVTATDMGPGSVFDEITVNGSSSGGISLLGVTGTTVLGDGSGTDLDLTTTVQPALFLNNAGTVIAAAEGTDDISSTLAPAVDVTNTPDAALDLDAVSSNGSTGDGLNLDNAGAFAAQGGTIENASGFGLDLNGGSGDVSYGGDLSNGSGIYAVEITARSGGAVALSGSIGDTNDVGGGIVMVANSGGTFTFSGPTKRLDTGPLPAFTSTGSNPTIAFTGGGLDIDTTSAPGFTTTGGGTVTVQGSGNSIASMTGTALNVSATSIGANDLTFESISAGHAGGGPGMGIILASTGASGNLAVTGNGGTCASAATCTGGAIQNTALDGISLTSTRDVALDSMLVLDARRDGVVGTGVTNLSLDNMRIEGAGDSFGEHSLDFATPSTNNLLGTASITDSTITNSHQHHLAVENVSGTLTTSVTDTEFTLNHATQGGDGILYQADGTADMTLNAGETVADGCLFQNLNRDGIQALTKGTGPAGSTSELTLNVDGCTFDTLGGGGQGAVGLRATGNTRGFFDIRNNTMTNIELAGSENAAQDDSEVTGTLENNTITNTGGEAILMLVDGGPSLFSPVLRTLIEGNTLSGQRDIGALRVTSREGNGGIAHVRLEENTISAPLDVASGGDDGAILSAEDGMSICLDIRDNDGDDVNNSSAGTNEPSSGLAGYRLSDQSTGSFQLEGFTTGGDVQSFLNAEDNTGSVAVPGDPLEGTPLCTTP
jgi:Bacterial Ig domain/Bacterial cadherin-like domain/RTX calcium-binding nonapeptide repeat (4 copies)